MSNGGRLVLDNVLYHIMVRGNQKQKIFIENDDFKKYLQKLKKYKKRYRFKLYGFCLMPNHVHLIGEIKNKNDLAKLMQGINRSYTAYFNYKYEKVGHLWQGRFKSKIIVKDRYVVDCINYVESNPARAKIVLFPQEYAWSSYRERVLSLNISDPILDALSL